MKRSIFSLLIFFVIAVPSFLSAELKSVVINEIAWPVNVAYATNGLKMGTVVINEVAWMGSPIDDVEPKQWWRYEWLELYNASDASVVLDGWTVELSREKLDFRIPLQGTIEANSYFLIGASDKIPNLDLNYKNLGAKFFNGGQKVVLKNSLGEIIDEVDARSGWPAGDNKTKQTMERKAIVGTVPTTQEGWQTSKDSGGTPKAPNSAGIKLSLTKDEDHPKPGLGRLPKPGLGKDETEKDPVESFQSRVPIVNPITLLAGLLALGFSGVLLLVKRYLAVRQNSGQASRQKHQKVEHPEQSRRV